MSETRQEKPRHNPPASYRNKSCEEYATDLSRFLFEYKWIFSSQLVAFFEEKIGDQIPENWVASLALELDSLIYLHEYPDSKEHFKTYEQWPESLRSYLETCQKLQMPRSISHFESDFPFLDCDTPFESLKLDKILCLGMKQKKIHEVEHLSSVVNGICQKSGNIKSIVDVGSGKGYIAQALSHHYGYHVIGLEGNEGQHSKASKRINETEKRFSKQKENAPIAPSTNDTVYHYIDYDVSTEELDTILTEKLVGTKKIKTAENSSSSSNSDPICLMSLHACGDLSPCILKLFSEWDRARTLVNVGCCYHKILQKNLDNSKAFPMSSSISNILAKNNLDLRPHLNWLELATNCPLKWKEMDKASLELRVNKLVFRAILQIMLNRSLSTHPQLKEEYSSLVLHIQKMKSGAVFVSFEKYVTAALSRLKIKKRIPNSTDPNATIVVTPEKCMDDWNELKTKIIETSSIYCEEFEKDRQKVAMFLSLQIALAPVAESLVILDRWLFLEEKMNSKLQAKSDKMEEDILKSAPSDLERACIVPVFDQSESPRNLAIVAFKKNS